MSGQYPKSDPAAAPSAIVTGAASGIGYGISRCLMRHGWRVFLLGRHDNVRETADRLNADYQEKYPSGKAMACGLVADVTNRTQVKEALEQIETHTDRIDGLVNNAGAARLSPFTETEDDLLMLQIRTNLLGSWIMTQEVIPRMRRQQYGRIVMISSVTGYLEADPGYAAYGMTKAGLVGLAKSLAGEYAGEGITVNAICPGFILTPNVRRNAGVTNPEHPEEVLKAMGDRVPAGHLGDVEDVGELVAFLLSRESGYITGDAIVIDGGNRIPETGVMGIRKDSL